MDSSQCTACGKTFIREGSLTKHLRDHCSAAHRRSQEQWKNGVPNMIKFSRPRHLRTHLRSKIDPPGESLAECEPAGLTHSNTVTVLISFLL
jgi:uncharacterized Zn-finger protein